MTSREVFVALWLAFYIIYRCVVSVRKIDREESVSPIETCILGVGIGSMIVMLTVL